MRIMVRMRSLPAPLSSSHAACCRCDRVGIWLEIFFLSYCGSYLLHSRLNKETLCRVYFTIMSWFLHTSRFCRRDRAFPCFFSNSVLPKRHCYKIQHQDLIQFKFTTAKKNSLRRMWLMSHLMRFCSSASLCDRKCQSTAVTVCLFRSKTCGSFCRCALKWVFSEA